MTRLQYWTNRYIVSLYIYKDYDWANPEMRAISKYFKSIYSLDEWRVIRRFMREYTVGKPFSFIMTELESGDKDDS